MTKSIENMEIPTLGNTALRYSTICPLELLSMEKLSVFMEVSVLKLKPLTKSEPLIEKFKSLMKDLSVILCGQILKILRTGLSMPEVQVGCSDQKLPMISVTSTESN